jgi:hypothetical protein
MNLSKRDKVVCGQQVALLVVGAIEAERVELSHVVATIHEPVGAAPTCVEPRRDDVSNSTGPLALNTQQSRPQIKDQVVTLVIERSRDTETELESTR